MENSVDKLICVKCKKERETESGKICHNRHFICSSCKTRSRFFWSSELMNCPVCDHKLWSPVALILAGMKIKGY